MFDMSLEEQKDWIALNLLSYKKPEIFLKLLMYYGSASAVICAGRKEFCDIQGVDRLKLKSILSMINGREVNEELEEVNKKNISVITLADGGYPELLKEISAPPPVLYCKGTLKGDLTGIAVIGTRKPSEYGEMIAEKFSSDIVENGISVISGMARGIDTIAHIGALKKNGYTVAVLGCGIDRIYPSENRKLYDSICDKGAVISEFPIGTSPHKMNFPRRNRIVSGMSRATLVIEAGERSGTLITARFALEQNRDVFAVPGMITSSKSKGTNRLIKKGAILAESFKDIAEHLGESFATPSVKNCSNENDDIYAGIINFPENSEESSVLLHIDDSPRHIDLISRKCGISIGRVSSILMKLEIIGAVRQISGKMFMRNYA